MSANEIPASVLATVTGGLSPRGAYRESVKSVTAIVGGWQLANRVYGSRQHGASWTDKRRAMRGLKQYLDASDQLPAWAWDW
jgi:hypothetical protein